MATRGKQSRGSKTSSAKSTQKRSSRGASTRSTTSRAKSTPSTKSLTRSAAADAGGVPNKARENKDEALYHLIGHALHEKSFRDDLLKNPEKTLQKFGYQVDDQVLRAIKKADPAMVQSLAEQFNSSARSGGST